MTQALPTLHGTADVPRVVADILRLGRPRPGLTLVGLLDLRNREVVAVSHLETPEPLPSDACDVPGELSMLMSPALCALAQREVPPSEFVEGRGWTVPEHELITVVCREGDPTPSPVEHQFFWGWRYSNHLTAAFHGDVYAVTPAGWAGLLGGSGERPVLTADEEPPPDDVVRFPELARRRALLVDPAVRAAAAVLADAALAEVVPEPGECLQCYTLHLFRMLGCDQTLRIARRYRDAVAPRAVGLEARLARMGVTCDCQLVEAYGVHPAIVALEQAAWDAGVEAEEPAGPVDWPFECFAVRKGSTQPCALWLRRR